MALEIYAGENALKTIKQQGFKQELFTSFLGASGGPKWFVLSGMDKYLFGDFFQSRNTPLNVIGSSIGSFRAACFCQQDPVDAINRFIDAYLEVVYEGRPSPQEITDSSEPILNAILGEPQNGIAQIINNPIFKAHFIVTKTSGLAAYENRPLQLLGAIKSFLFNGIKRSLLNGQYQRFIFQQKDSDFTLSDPDGFVTKSVSLTQSNLKDALLASGCIPLAMAGIQNISGAEHGMYRDGGIIDYHFDFNINNPGLTLYPHFSSTIKPGWFDKALNRSFQAKHYENIVVICPSKAFVASLPFGKISDRTDFTEMDDATRIDYWKTLIERSTELADELQDFVLNQYIEKIQPISVLSRQQT